MIFFQKSIVSKCKFPLILVGMAVMSFSDNIEAILFFEVLEAVKTQWKINYFTLEIIIFIFSLSCFLGSYFSLKLLSYPSYTFLVISCFFQIISCVVGSFSKSIFEMCATKFIYGFFYGASSKMIILLLVSNIPTREKFLNYSLISLQIFQSFIKMWLAIMTILYKSVSQNWEVLWLGNILPTLIFLFGIGYIIRKYVKNSLNIDFIKNSLECHNINIFKKNFAINYKKIIVVSLTIALIEYLSKIILIVLPFSDENKKIERLNVLFIIIGEFLGLFIGIFSIIYGLREKKSKFFCLCLIFAFILICALKLNSSLFLLLVRIVFSTVKILFYQILFQLTTEKQVLNFFLMNDFILIIISFTFRPFINNEDLFSVILLFASGISSFVLYKLDRQNEEKLIDELELSLLTT